MSNDSIQVRSSFEKKQQREGKRQADKELGGLGPFSAEEVAALVSSAFIGAESLYLLGAEKKGAPVRQSLRRVGDAIRMAEGKSPKR